MLLYHRQGTLATEIHGPGDVDFDVVVSVDAVGDGDVNVAVSAC